MKLISMTDFVLEQIKRIMNVEITHLESHNQIVDYANFLKQSLKLEMFVPCSNENGLPLSLEGLIDSEGFVLDEIEFNEYEKAKEKVLFEGFDLDTAKFHCNRNDRTIEYFTSFDVKLTPNAIKRIFG